MKISELAGFLQARSVPFVLLGDSETGRALVMEEGARVLALTAAGSEENVFWIHPEFKDCANRNSFSSLGAGGMGGLRLWQSPEQVFMWRGRPDPLKFSNYEVQPAIDPGRYALKATSSHRGVLRGSARLNATSSEESIELEIRRIVEIFPLPERYQIKGSKGVTLRVQNSLRLTDLQTSLCADLWHLIQLPANVKIGAFVTRDTEPRIYMNPDKANGWALGDGVFLWDTNGQRQSKIGLSAHSLTGGLFARRDLGSSQGVYFWNIPVFQTPVYVDAPAGESRTDQAVQFWDGFGYCELEYHSPGVTAERPEVFDTSELIYLEVPNEELDRIPAHFGIPRR